jgi:hypothetical protein
MTTSAVALDQRQVKVGETFQNRRKDIVSPNFFDALLLLDLAD